MCRQAKMQNEFSCISGRIELIFLFVELKKSGVFLNTMKTQYQTIRELARQGILFLKRNDV